MEAVDEVDALVVGGAGEIVGTVEDQVARLRLKSGLGQEVAERHAGPFADGAPALDAVVAGDLGAGRHRAKLGEREGLGRLDEAVERELPVGEAGLGVALVVGRVRLGVAVGAELRRHLGGVELASHRLGADQPVDVVGEPFARAEHDVAEARAVAEPVTAGQKQRRRGEAGRGEELAAGDHGFSFGRR